MMMSRWMFHYWLGCVVILIAGVVPVQVVVSIRVQKTKAVYRLAREVEMIQEQEPYSP